MSRDMEKCRERRTNRFSTFCSSLFITSVYINLLRLHHPCLISLLVPSDTTTTSGGGGGGAGTSPETYNSLHSSPLVFSRHFSHCFPTDRTPTAVYFRMVFTHVLLLLSALFAANQLKTIAVIIILYLSLTMYCSARCEIF